MKSPWRILTDFVSGRKSETKVAPLTKDDATAGTGTVSAPLRLVYLEPISTVAELDPSEPETNIDVAALGQMVSIDQRPAVGPGAIDGATKGDVEAVVTGQSRQAPERSVDAVHARDPLSAPRQQRRMPRRVRANSDPDATQIAPLDPATAARSSIPRSFTESVAELDEEVHELRTLLAEKLRRQNAQLRQMLERFETS